MLTNYSPEWANMRRDEHSISFIQKRSIHSVLKVALVYVLSIYLEDRRPYVV